MDDYHFVTVDGKKGTGREKTQGIFKLLMRFTPVFILAATLPFMMFFVLSPPDIGIMTQANTDPELRIWIEPQTVVTEPGRIVELRVMAAFDDDRKLIPFITVTASSSGDLELVSETVEHETPFNGQVELGTIEVSAQGLDGGRVEIPEGEVTFRAFEDPVEIVTSSAEVVVRRP